MRALLIFTVLLAGHLSAYAQFTKGDHYFSAFALQDRSFLYNDYLTVNADHAELSLWRNDRSESQLLLAGFAEYGRFSSSHVLLGSGVALGIYSDLNFFSPIIGLSPFARHYLSANTGPSRFYIQLQGKVLLLLGGGEVTSSIGGNLQFGLTQLLSEVIAFDGYMGVARGGGFGQQGTELLLGTQLSVYLTKEGFRQRKHTTSAMRPGTIMLGGTSAAMSWEPPGNDNFNTERFSLNVSPNIYYFLTTRLAFGAGLTWRYEDFTTKDRNDSFRTLSSRTHLAISPQLRYYISEPGAHLRWFLATGCAFVKQRIKNNIFLPGFDSRSDETVNQTEFALGVGLNSFITPQLALELGPNLRYENGGKSYRLAFDVGLQYFLGGGGED